MSTKTVEEFVRAWMDAVKNGQNQAQLAEVLGVSRQYVSARANFLRKRGVKLPKMKRSPNNYNTKPIDVEALNELIKEAKQ